MRLKKLAWARSFTLCETFHYQQLEPEHLFSRYFDCLLSNMRTEDIDSLFKKSSIIAYSASKDFQITNPVGYFLAIFDNLRKVHVFSPKLLETKLKSNRKLFQDYAKLAEDLKLRISEDS